MIPLSILFENTRFKEVLADTKKQAKEYTKKITTVAADKLHKEFEKDLISQGFIIEELKLNVGQFRGHSYFSSCKMTLRPKGRIFTEESQTSKLLAYLKETYSSKFKFKAIDSQGNVKFSIR